MTKPAPFYTDDFSHEWFVEWNTDTDRPVVDEWWISVEVHEPPHAVRPVATIETIEGKAEDLRADDLRKLAGHVCRRGARHGPAPNSSTKGHCRSREADCRAEANGGGQ